MPNGALAVYSRTTSGTIVGTSQPQLGAAFGPWVQIGSGGVAGALSVRLT
jgi:hypothetical protein